MSKTAIRAALEAQYKLKGGIIISPGKFEGERLWAPHFHDATLDGTAEELDHMEDGAGEYVALVEISADDRAAFPEIDDRLAFALVTVNDQGFARVTLVTSQRADQIRESYELAAQTEDDSEGDGE